MPRTDLTSIASALQASPGAYALLLGAGTSRAAGVPTGWDVAVDLIRRRAAAEGVTELDDPAAWYREQHAEDPNYSDILEGIAPGQADRQALLARYFTPTDDDLAEGRKVPTAAHRAIARLVRSGAVKVILTTNFDRLVEQALAEVGIQPLVVSTSAGAEKAPPLHSVPCMIIKVHGDQSSPDLRNTLAELDRYDEPMERLVARVLDEHGLVVCGWSATWDPALRRLLIAHQSTFYTTFWAAHGSPSREAQEVLQSRLSFPLPIDGADGFFEDLASKVDAISSIVAAGPTGAEVAVAELKRYLDDPTARIRLSDLVIDSIRECLDATGSDQLPVDQRGLEPITYDAHLAAIESAAATVVPLLANLGFYARTSEHDDLAVRAIRQLARRPMVRGGVPVLLNAQRYPALLGFYALGLGALANRRVRPLARCLSEVQAVYGGRDEALGLVISPDEVLSQEQLRAMDEFARHHTPASDRLHARLRPHLAPFLPNEDEYDSCFDNLEYLLGLAVFAASQRWGPVGRFWWRRRWSEVGRYDEVLQLHEEELLEAGMFEGSADTLAEVRNGYDDMLAHVHYR